MNLRAIVPALLLCAAPAAAQQPVARPKLPELIQEFFLVETVYPQERHETQLTAQLATSAHTPWLVLADFGITDRFQVTAQLESPEEGVHTTELGLLYALLPYEAPLALSLSAAVAMADGDSPVWSPAVVAARRFGRLQLHGSITAELGEDQALAGGVGAMFDAGRLTPTLEWATSNEAYLVPGLFLHFPRSIELGAGLPLSLTGDVDPALHLMFTIEF